LEKDRAEASRERVLAQQMRADYEQRFGSAALKANDVVEKARAQAIQMMTNARREAEAVIDELKSALKHQRESDRMQTIQSARSRLSEARQSLEDQGPKRIKGDPPQGLKPGDAVTILSLGQTAYVLAEPDGSGHVLVQAGILKITVSLLDLERANQPKPASAGKKGIPNRMMSKGTGLSKAREIETELDLRGLTVDEALDKVEKHLDDAVMAGAPMIRIIHGKGTGALRKAVTDLLKSHQNVAAHRLGGMGEGGDGVTVATLSL
jgi:DNA mismatch repair protein MutS2